MNLYARIAQAQAQGRPVAVCTVVRTRGSTPRRSGAKMLVYADGSLYETIGGGTMESKVIAEAQQALQDGRPRLLTYRFVDPQRGDVGVCGGEMEVLVEAVMPPATVIVIGAGHVGKAVAHLAKWLGYRVLINDDRPEFCSPDFIPDADGYYPVPMSELPSQVVIHPQTYLVLTTRGVPVDVAGLPALLETPAAYIGIIGSRRRWQTTRKALLAAGLPEERLQRVVSPIGLELNAETPEEIAVSIMAQIIMQHRGGDGRPMAPNPVQENNHVADLP
ncbi:MAG: XdhC/CoxI family protein [Anaerolineales bacterium]